METNARLAYTDLEICEMLVRLFLHPADVLALRQRHDNIGAAYTHAARNLYNTAHLLSRRRRREGWTRNKYRRYFEEV